MEATVDESRLKSLLKEAVEEVLHEKHDLLAALVREAIEDIGLRRAIEESQTEGFVARDEVFRALNPQA